MFTDILQQIYRRPLFSLAYTVSRDTVASVGVDLWFDVFVTRLHHVTRVRRPLFNYARQQNTGCSLPRTLGYDTRNTKRKR